MTFIGRPVAPFKTDFLRVSFSGTMTNNPVAVLSGSLDNTNATISGNTITVYSGSHWRIEYSNSIIQPAILDYGTFSRIYSVTDAATIGTRGVMCAVPANPPSNTQYLTMGRAVACALILDSDISTSKTLQFEVEGNAADLTYYGGSLDTRFQYGILRVLEIPA